MQEESSGNQCCNRCFDFSLEGLENVEFYAGEGSRILVTYTKDGSIYHAISFDCGRTFSDPRKIMDIKGKLREMKVLAKGNQFVVATLEREFKNDIKRAVAGMIDPDKETFTFKECTRHQKDKILNLSLGFRPYDPTGQQSEPKEGSEAEQNTTPKEESVDHVFYMDENGKICMECHGHGCLIK
jgi:hypothetical protein